MHSVNYVSDSSSSFELFVSVKHEPDVSFHWLQDICTIFHRPTGKLLTWIGMLMTSLWLITVKDNVFYKFAPLKGGRCNHRHHIQLHLLSPACTENDQGQHCNLSASKDEMEQHNCSSPAQNDCDLRVWLHTRKNMNCRFTPRKSGFPGWIHFNWPEEERKKLRISICL